MKLKLLMYTTLIFSFSAFCKDITYSAKEILLNLEVNSFENSLRPQNYRNDTTFKQTEFTHGEYD
ncbi:TPA: pesticin immunity protein, partial [Klebsiella pneumoniae]|nr:pesticin immunity protein [Salmonella enterica subsp. enterica serovar Montevideo]HBI5523610.1 pesticin immunity protein [Salmonella enterica subsp. enterica serovar Welikade]HBR4304960.1 pesticin immunity protein [Klebsiella pneumoniae]